MGRYCSVPHCKSKWKAGNKHMKFHQFPKDKSLAEVWETMTGKPSTASSFVCSLHFKAEEDYITTSMGQWKILRPGSIPSKNLPYPAPKAATALLKSRQNASNIAELDCQHLVANDQESVDNPVDTVGFEDILDVAQEVEIVSEMEAESVRFEDILDVAQEVEIVSEMEAESVRFEDILDVAQEVEIVSEMEAESVGFEDILDVAQEVEIVSEMEAEHFHNILDVAGEVEMVTEIATDTVRFEEIHDVAAEGSIDTASCMYATTSSQTFFTLHQDKFISFVSLSSEEVLYFTGFEVDRFNAVFEFVSRYTLPLISACSSKDQLLVTLCKYKHNLDFKMLSFLFRLTPKSTSKIFSHWTNIIYTELKKIDFWSLGRQDSNLCYRVILDCTEIFVDKSENPLIHQLTYSQYKSRPTFKCLIGVDESGLIVFCSELFVGSTSDRMTVILSNFVDNVKNGETVLADRGFEISDLLEAKGVALNIPPFLRGKKQLTEHEVMETRKLANRRIHVERLIGLVKLNQILNDPMPSFLWPIATKIMFNCSMLCNFKARIVHGIPKKSKKKKKH